MAEFFEVPEKRCSNGHLVPTNGKVISKVQDQFQNPKPIVLQTSRLICEQCAIEASFGETLEGMRHRPVRGKRLGKLGQESFLNTVPAKFIS